MPTLGGGPGAARPGGVPRGGARRRPSLLAAVGDRRRAKLEAFAREHGLELWRSQRPSGWARSDDALADLIGHGPDQRPSQAPGTDDLLAALAAMIGPTTSIETLASGSISGHPALVADVCWFRRRFSAVWLDVRRDEEMIAGAEAEPAARRLLGLPARVADDRDLLARGRPGGCARGAAARHGRRARPRRADDARGRRRPRRGGLRHGRRPAPTPSAGRPAPGRASPDGVGPRGRVIPAPAPRSAGSPTASAPATAARPDRGRQRWRHRPRPSSAPARPRPARTTRPARSGPSLVISRSAAA